MRGFDKLEYEFGFGGRFQRFQDLMLNRVEEILLVSSLYDFFVLSEDGGLYESLYQEYVGLGLTHVPRITRVSSGDEAMLRLSREPDRFDIVIVAVPIRNRQAFLLARQIKRMGADIPVVLLAWDEREREQVIVEDDFSVFDKVFVWQGDFRIFLAIIKHIEDRLNVENDTRLVAVQSIIVIEDDVRFYSSFLPMIYKEIVEHTTHLISEGVNEAHRRLRMRARPKILLCSNYEEAWDYFETYNNNILGVISDIKFPRNGELDPQAGFAFAKAVKAADASIPVLFQSSDSELRGKAEQLGGFFIEKGSEVFLQDLRHFMVENLGFGDFVFRMPDGHIVDRARDLRDMADKLAIVPEASLRFHGGLHHFSKWLKARTEHILAKRWRPINFDDFDSDAAVRKELIGSLEEHFQEQHAGSVVDFHASTFDSKRTFSRIWGGSLGGKARGLAFLNALLTRYGVEYWFDGVRVGIPSVIVLGTDVFDYFLDHNELREFALRTQDDEEIERRFLSARLPEAVSWELREFLEKETYPLSVRSSSLLEDSQDMPFAGVYETYMIPNSYRTIEMRLESLLTAIKRVYASTFSNHAKSYVRSTPFRLEEEKMAVIIQRLVGQHHGNRFYPLFSGVARSYNYYPVAPMEAEDGIASIALGLGKVVVEGGSVVRFCPKYPKHILQQSNVDDVMRFSQAEFFALHCPEDVIAFDPGEKPALLSCGLEQAKQDGQLANVASTYSREENALYDGVRRKGVPVVTFAPILKHNRFPLPQILDLLLELGEYGMNSPVEIEFAVNLSKKKSQPDEFHVLQVRPMVSDEGVEDFVEDAFADESLICRSDSVLGNGVLREIHDLLVVDVETFERRSSRETAQELSAFNTKLLEDGRPYALIGFGRWGSADPWLGIPVRWEDISGARVIVEGPLQDVTVSPSQGTHFFHNLTSARVGYLTVREDSSRANINWDWLKEVTPHATRSFTKLYRFEKPLTIVMNGQDNWGVITKPGKV